MKKIIELQDGKYAYEEATITPNPAAGVPTVHSKAYKVHMWDLKEETGAKEVLTRLAFRAAPNCVAMSLYYRKTESGTNHLSIVENTLWKPHVGTWMQWWSDWKDRRDISRYLRYRWMLN